MRALFRSLHCQLIFLLTVYDTVDHGILLERLRISFGVTGAFLCWLESFLGERTLCVVHGPTRSPWVPAPYGLPQGSVLGPLLYIIYISDLAALLASYSALAQLYADDVQAYLHCSPSDAIATTRVMSSIMRALETWMSPNRLRLNSAKTQFIWLGTRQQLSRLDMAALSDAFPLLTFSSAVRDLGVTLDCQLTFATHATHINLLSRDCFYQLRQLRTVTRSLTQSATSTLVHAFVANRL